MGPTPRWLVVLILGGLSWVPVSPAHGNPESPEIQPVERLTQFGITWTFDKKYPAGQYANGDYWVVGPVKIISISPPSVDEDGRIRNGSQWNPVLAEDQGYDSAKGDMKYNPAKNAGRPDGKDLSAENPLVLSTGSLVSTISRQELQPRPQLKTAAILTVVSSAPEPGSFRPPPVGTDKTSHWNKRNLDYSLLKSLPPVAGTPSLDSVERYFEKPWLEQNTSWTACYIHPLDNQACYGKNIAIQAAEGLLSLHLDYPRERKETLYIRLVQYGIDIYGSAKAGAVWIGYGGHNQGRKMPLILAGLALNNAEILEYGDAAKHLIFQEDQQTWYVTREDVGRPLNTRDNRPHEPYREEDIGLPEWGVQHLQRPMDDGRNWNAYYRNICLSSELGHALAAHLTPGAVPLWNWPAFFDYMDRGFLTDQADKGGKSNPIPAFVANMWNTYRTDPASRR